MANRLQKTPRLVYVPAVQAVPARAPYCITRQVTGNSSGWFFFGDTSDADAYQPIGEIPEGWSGVKLDGYGTSYSSLRPVTRTEQVCYPGVIGSPAVAARMDQLDHVGWNAGGRSVDQVPNDGYFQCTLPSSPVGVQVGLCGRALQYNYADMQHSLVARRGAFSIVEAGFTVFGPGVLPAAARVEIRRVSGVVTYWVNGVQVYESAVPSSGEAYAGVLLYSVGDFVDSPGIESTIAPVSFAAQLPALVAAISDVGGQNFMLGRLPAIHLNAQLDPVIGVVSFAAQLPRLVAAISDVGGINRMLGALPPLTLTATLGPAEEMPNSMIAILPPPILSTVGLAGQSISFSAQLPSMIAAIADVPFNRVVATMPTRLMANIVEPYMPVGDTDGSDAMFVDETAVLETALLLIAMDSLEASSTQAVLTLILELSGFDSLGVSSDASIGWVVEMLALEQVAIVSRAGAARQQALQYAVNFMTGALTTYRDFDFLGFTYDDGHAYAWRTDGLYRLGVEGNGSEVVNALVDFGASDYGDAHKKRMAMAFIGVRTDGDCYLRLCADSGTEQVYRLIGTEPQKRAALAKGVDGRTWNVRLELTDATYASVDNIELEIGVSQRRGYGRGK